MQRTNTTSHYEIRYTDGAVAHDKCRDTFGGFCNMMRRIAAANGARDCYAVRTDANEIVDGMFHANGRQFELVEVNVL